MQNTILQDSTSLLKEINALNRKSAQPQRYSAKNTKAPNVSNFSATTSLAGQKSTHKKTPSTHSANSTGLLFQPTNRMLNVLQERINQLQGKVYETSKNSNIITHDLENPSPSPKKKTSPRPTRKAYFFYLFITF
jgi:hypothetical protein